jgi:hypothetical protein
MTYLLFGQGKEGMASPRGTDHILRRDYRLVIAAA